MKFDNRSYDFKTGYRLETGLPVSRLTSLVCLPPAVHPIVAIQQSTDTALVEIDVNKMKGLNRRYLPLPSDRIWSTKVDQPHSGPHWIHGLESVPRLVLALICSAASRCMTTLVSHAVKCEGLYTSWYVDCTGRKYANVGQVSQCSTDEVPPASAAAWHGLPSKSSPYYEHLVYPDVFCF